jgi:hypothetical protein
VEKVNIVHPETGGTATVSRRSYEQVWKIKGWRLARSKKTANKEKK